MINDGSDREEEEERLSIEGTFSGEEKVLTAVMMMLKKRYVLNNNHHHFYGSKSGRDRGRKRS